MRKPKVAIHIPIYNQPKKLRYCLNSIASQTLMPDKIILFDDDSTEDYSDLVLEYSFLNIDYVKNQKNLGAVPNMIHALYYQSDADYVNVFHEDDIMHPNFIEVSIGYLESNKDCSFSISMVSFFDKYDEICSGDLKQKYLKIFTQQKLILMFLEGKPLGFCSVFYKRQILTKVCFEYDKYNVLGDRPFLLKVTDEKPVLVLLDSLVFVYSHKNITDIRWKNLQIKHILNLYIFYFKSFDRKKLSFKKKKILDSGITYGVLHGYKLLDPDSKVAFPYFLALALLNRVLNIKYFLLSFSFIRKAFTNLKRLIFHG